MSNNSIVEMNPDADVCIVGYDPLPVVFRDMSDTRSFSTRYWEWDFGDSMYFGVSSADGFRLPSDKKLFGYITGWYGRENNDFTAQLDYFHEQVPNCVMCLDYKNNAWATYHKDNYGDDDHFTGLLMRSFSADASGSGCEFPPVPADRLNSEYDLKRYQFWPNSNDSTSGIIPVGVSGISVQKDECGRDSCETEEDIGNSVMHLYKGPGIYYSTMSCSSETGLQSMELTDKEFSSIPASAKKQHAGCFVRVLPVCPCVSAFNVYGTFGTGNWDDDNRKFAVITADNYSCESSVFSSSSGQVGFNCRVRYRTDSGKICDTIAVSGYAPYVKVGASGVIIPRSLPVTGAYIDWGDWYTDYMNADHKEFGAVMGGWPLWETASAKSISGEHVYTMPGVYSIGIAPEFDEDRIRNYMPTVVGYEDCIDSSLYANSSGCCVVVVELPPKFDMETPISHNNISDAYPTVITGMHANVSGGSYPISRIDWDFGDGTEILSISTEAAKIKDRDVSGNSDESYTVYKTDCTSATRLKPSSCISTSLGYFNGNGLSGGSGYERSAASNWEVTHIYNRTMVDDHPDGYVITVSAYAENTNTCTVASAKVLSGTGAALPPYALTEGEGGVELVDIRSGVQSDTNLVLQSAQQDRMYFNKLVEKEQSG